MPSTLAPPFGTPARSLSPPASLRPSLSPPGAAGGEAYAELLGGTRELRREHAAAREQWLSRLAPAHRDETLFELEVLLKGLACFTNPRNHAGRPRRGAIVAQDFRPAIALARDAMRRAVGLTRALLGDEERAFVFQRYLELLLPDDAARTRLVRGAARQDTPEESLFLLRRALNNLVEVSGALVRLPHVPFRLFYSVMSVAHREVAQSAFFNPLTALEFRPEFDRITNPGLLELMRQVPGEQARRLVALTFLALFRMLRYVALLERVARDERPAGLVHVIVSVLRSDARALTGYLQRHAGPQLADSFEDAIFAVPAGELHARYDGLLREADRLAGIRATLRGIAANVRLELGRVVEHDFAPPSANAAPDQLRASVAAAAATLRPALQNAILVLGKALGTRLDEHGVFDDRAARRSLSLRLRRDVWMLAQVVRAFGAKAQAAPADGDRWSGPSSLRFVREFLSYFEAIGYPLLRAADYPRMDAFLASMRVGEDGERVDPERLSAAVAEAERFHAFLVELFDQIGRREELRGVPFDRREAAETLALYLRDERRD